MLFPRQDVGVDVVLSFQDLTICFHDFPFQPLSFFHDFSFNLYQFS